MTISMDKTYRTRVGHEVRIYAVDGYRDYPIHGAIMEDGWCVHNWTENGKGALSRYDLIEVKPRIKRTVWLNVYEYPMQSPHVSKETANHLALEGRLACVKVEIDCEEGEGL